MSCGVFLMFCLVGLVCVVLGVLGFFKATYKTYNAQSQKIILNVNYFHKILLLKAG